MKRKIVFINSHPIQYFAPLYKALNDADIETEAWYCDGETQVPQFDTGFNSKVQWDIPLFDGYNYRFFKNYSLKPSHSNGYWGLINFGMIKKLFSIPKAVIVVHGWHYFTHSLIICLAKLKGHIVCLRSENPLNQEQRKKGWRQKAKKAILKYLLFSRIDYFLYIGTENKYFYESYGVKAGQLLFCPYSVDNSRFCQQYLLLKDKITSLKEIHHIKENSKVIVYAAKYIDKKRPLDLLNAFQKINKPQYTLVMVGEGVLRKELEKFIEENPQLNIILTGFVNQSKIAEYYSISDLFVMCSEEGETWGLSVNEAMNFGLPLVVSDLTGCSTDLVEKGVNGFRFETGNAEDLAVKIEAGLQLDKQQVKRKNRALLTRFSYHTIIQTFHHLKSIQAQ